MTSTRICHHFGPPAYTHADLCARVAPLDSYGLTGISSALAESLSALASASKQAFSALRLRILD